VRLPFRRRPTASRAGHRDTSPKPAPAWISAAPAPATLAPVPVTARAHGFVDGLAARKRVGIARAGLMHEVALGGPAGLAAGLVAPAPAERERSSLDRLWARAFRRRSSGTALRTDDRAAAPRGRLPVPAVEPHPVPAPPNAPEFRERAGSSEQRSSGAPSVSATLPLRARAPALPTALPPDATDPRRDFQLSPRKLRSTPDAGPTAASPGELRPGAGARRRELHPLLGQRRSPAAASPAIRAVDDTVSSAPESVRAPVEQRFGVDLSHVAVHRGALAGQEAERIRAQAFTAAGDVHLPADAGPLETGRGRTLLTHELVHAVQQRRLAPALPAERSSDGRALEAEARSMEAAARSAPRSAVPEGSGTVHLPSDPGPSEALFPHRAPGPIAGSSSGVGPPAGIQRAEEAAETPHGPVAEPSIDDVVTRIYDRISSRLRAELLIDRERVGALTDVR